MLKRGNEATFKKNQSEKVQMKDVRLSLKDGESVKVVICTTQDYVQVPSHNDFNLKVFPQACHGDGCPLCAIANLGDDYKSLKVKDRYKFAMAVVDQDKIMVFDATSGQAKKLKSQLVEYAEDIEFGAIFTFKRTGTAKDTDYSLSLISERKYTAKDKEMVAKYKGYQISDEFFEDVSEPVSRKYVIKMIDDNMPEIDVRAMFEDADALLAEVEADATKKAETTQNADLTKNNGDLPFKA